MLAQPLFNSINILIALLSALFCLSLVLLFGFCLLVFWSRQALDRLNSKVRVSCRDYGFRGLGALNPEPRPHSLRTVTVKLTLEL